MTHNRRTNRDQPERQFWDRVQVNDGCWAWTGAVKNGYGATPNQSSITYAHRFSWELAYGPIPPGLVVDHDCHNQAVARGECNGGECRHRLCVNPAHLVLRGIAANSMESPLHNANKTHCKRGHEFDEANTYRDGKGYRRCRRCVAAYDRGRAR